VLTEELAPRPPAPLRRGPPPGLPQDQPHGAIRTAPAEFAQLAFDPPIAPAGLRA
jgi:hypothetical protein